MAGQTDDDRPGREPLRALLTACGVLLAGASLAALVLTDNPKNLRVALVGALWAFLLVSITGRFRPQSREAVVGESDEELKRYYQMELQQEVAARREYELRLEVQLRRELEESRTQEIEDLRAEVHRLRAELMGIEAPDRAALLASAARLSPDQMRVLKEEAQRPQPRPAERLQLPAGFSDSPPPPPPADSSPSFAPVPPAPPVTPAAPAYVSAAPPADPHPSLPGLPGPVRPSGQPETFTPTEFIPAASHGNAGNGKHGNHGHHGHHGTRGNHGTPAGSASSVPYRLPEPYRGPSAKDAPAAPPAAAYREAHQPADPHGTPADDASGTHRPPSQSWSTYASPTASQELKRPTFASPSPSTSTDGYDAAPSSYGSTSYDGYSTSTSGQHAVIEPYGSGRHASLAADASVPPVSSGSSGPSGPFDPSNTWPGAFKAPRGDADVTPPLPRSPEPYPPQPAEWRPAERSQSAPRGRHHAGDDDEENTPSTRTNPPTSRPDDDVLAQILGRW